MRDSILSAMFKNTVQVEETLLPKMEKKERDKTENV